MVVLFRERNEELGRTESVGGQRVQENRECGKTESVGERRTESAREQRMWKNGE
jgi:hypothetical protein